MEQRYWLAVMAKLKDVLQLAEKEAGARGKRSELYRWMHKNYEEFAQNVRDGYSWDSLSVALAKIGLTDRDNKPPTKRTCQQTFYKVRREKELARRTGKAVGPAKPALARTPIAAQPAGVLGPRRPPRPMD